MIDELYQQIELEMLANIGKIIGNGNGVDEDDIINWQVQKLSQLGQLGEAQIKTLAKYAGMTAEQMTVFIQQTAITEVAAYDMLMDDMTEGKVLYTPPSNTLYTALEALEKQGQSVINMINTNLLQASGQVYTDILTRSAAQVLTGNITLQQALVDTAGEWAKQGMPVLVDKAGRTWSTEAYVNMVTRATQKNVATSMQESRMDDYEIDLVEISSHAASRPTHIDYQGKIYSRSGESKTYPSLKDTSYGKGADGLVTGIGCNHIAYPFIEGVSTKRYEPYNKKESVEAYKQSQKQRYLEREIRRSKKELSMLEQMGVDADEIALAKQNLKDKLENMEDFIDETGRTRYKQKERVVDVGKKVDIPKNAKVLTKNEVAERIENGKGVKQPIKKDVASLTKELGEKNISLINGLSDDISEEVLTDNLDRINQLMDKFPVVKKYAKEQNIKIGTITEKISGKGTNAAVGEYGLERDKMVLRFNPKHYSNVDSMKLSIKEEIKKGWSMPSAEKYGHVYDTTHEFGHMVQISLDREWIKANPAELEKILTRQRKANTLSAGLKVSKSWSDKLAMRHFKEIEQIFNSENKGEKIFDYISDYGKTSYEEAFAEMFANSQCGDVNKAGEAMAKYLEKVIQVED